MKPFFYINLLFLVICSDSFALRRGDTLKIYSLDNVFSAALKNNPNELIFEQRLKEAVYRYQAAKGFEFPNIAGTFTGTDNLHLAVTPIPGEFIGRPGTVFDAQFGSKYNYNAGVAISQTIFDLQSVYQVQIEKNNIKLSRLRQNTFVQTLKEELAKIYFSALVAKESLNISEKDLTLADSLVILFRQRLEEGATDELSFNQAQINLSNVQQKYRPE